MIRDQTDADRKRPARGWATYSLRGLFALVTLVAIATAWIVDRYERPRRAAAELLARGADVRFADDETLPKGWERWFRAWLPDAWFRRVTYVELKGPQFDGRDVANVGCLRSVGSVSIQGAKANDDDVRRLSGLRELSCLVLSGTSLSGRGLAALKHCERLDRLEL